MLQPEDKGILAIPKYSIPSEFSHSIVDFEDTSKVICMEADILQVAVLTEYA
jgi:hypothetical protein